MKKKIWKSLIICLAVLLVGAAGIVGALVLKNKTASNQSQVVSGEMTAGDAETLRALLLAEGECSITLTEDVTVTEQLLVNGTKTLLGNKSIIMDTSNIGTSESVCAVMDSATLILDGATIHGNGVSNGIAVKIGGKLTCFSGNIVYGYPYGLTIAGVAEIEDVTIYNAMHTGIYVEYGGEATMTGGTVYKNVYGIVVASGADMSIGENAIIKNSNEQLVSNYGTVEITGGEYHDSYGHGILSKGELKIAGSANKKIEIYNVKKAAVNANNKSKLTASNLYIHDVGTHAFCIEKKTEADIQDCVIQKTGKSSVYISASNLVMEDVTVSDVTSYAIYAAKKSEVEIKDIAVKNAGSRGITNDGAKLTAKNVVVQETQKNGIHTMGENAVTSLENVEIIKTGTNAIAVTEGTVNGKNITIKEPTYEGLYLMADTKMELDNVTITKSGMTSVQNNGGTLAVRELEIIDSANMGIKSVDAGTVAVTGGVIKNSASHALAFEEGSVATIKDCKIIGAGNKNVKTAVYVSASKMNMYDSEIEKCASYGIYVTDSKKATEKQVALQNVTVTNVGTDAKKHRGIANVGSWITVTNAKVSDTAGAGIYTQGKNSITYLNEVTVTNAGTCGLGFTGGEASVRNVTIMTPKNEGVYVGKEAKVNHLDNATITNPGTHGIGNYGGKIHVTVDKKYNPENKNDNGVTITNPGGSGILSRGGEITVKNSTIKNATKHAVCIEENGNAIMNGCNIDKTSVSAVYVSKSSIEMKNAQIKNAESYGIYVTDSAKADGKVAILDNVTVTKPGTTDKHRGIANVNSYVVATNIEVTESTGAGIYTSGASAVTNMNEIVVTNAEGCGLGLSGGEVTARNVTITTPKKEGIYVGADANVKQLDDVIIEAPGLEGIGNYGGTINITADKKFNPENDKDNGVTITGAKGCGIWNQQGGIVTGKNVTIDGVEKYGIKIDKDTTVTLDNATINNVTGKDREGINCAGTLNVTADNKSKNGLTITTVASGHGIFVAEDGVVKADRVSINKTSRKGLYVCGNADVTAKLTINNTGEHGVQVGVGAKATLSGFKIKNTNSAGTTSAAIYALENAELTMTNGTVAEVPTHGIYVEKAKVEITNASITNLGSEGVYNIGGTVTINGGAITEAAGCGIWNKEGGTVTGSNFTIDTITKYGVFVEAGTTANLDNVTLSNINGGTTERSAIQCLGTVNITANNETKKGVTITNVTNGHGIFVAEDGVVNADRVSISETSKKGLYVCGNADVTAKLTVDNVGEHGIQVNPGAKATISGFEIKNTNSAGTTSAAIYALENAELTMKNGTIEGVPTHGVYVEKAKVELTNASITNPGSEGVYNIGGTVTINGGKITEAAGCGIWNKEGGTVTGSNFTIDTITKFGIYVEAGTTANLDNVTLSNINGGTTERSAIQCLGTVNITANNETKKGVTITEVENGHGIFVNNGKITADQVTIQGASKSGLFVAGGTEHVVTNINVSDIGMQGMQFTSGAEATINGFNVSDTNEKGSATAIYTSGASKVILNNGTVSATKNGLYLDGTSQVTATNLIVERTAGNVNTLVVVKSGTTFTLNEENAISRIDGKSSEGANYVGRGVELQGTFIMNAGIICNNKVTSQAGTFNTDKPKDGGGVYVLTGGKFTMNGGIISGNSADCGGGVSVYGDGASFTFAGGTIKENQARAGAGVINRKGTFLMKGGTISANNASENGGGICLISGQNFTMNGGTISSNNAANKGGAIYGYGNNTITLNKGTISGNTATKDSTGNGIHSGAKTVTISIGSEFDMQDTWNKG